MSKWNIKDVGIIHIHANQTTLILFDSVKSYIGQISIEHKTMDEILQVVNDLLNIKHISELVNLGFCSSMMYDTMFEIDVQEKFVEYGIKEGLIKGKDNQILTCKDVEKIAKDFNLHINLVGDVYFITNYDDYFEETE